MLTANKITRTALMTSLVTFAMVGSASAQYVGSVFSGPTDADGAAAYWNPAAMSRAEGGGVVDLGWAGTRIAGEFTPGARQDGSGVNDIRGLPTFGVISPQLGKNVRVGLTVGIPFGGGISWDREDSAADVTRYYFADVTQFFLVATPAISYALSDKLAIGGGVHLTHARISADLDTDVGSRLNTTLGSETLDSPLPGFNAAFAAPTSIKTSGNTIGGSLSLLYSPSESVTIGASVHTPLSVTTTGKVRVTYSEELTDALAALLPSAELPPIDSDAEFAFDAPMAAYLSGALRVGENSSVRADYRYQRYSAVPSSTIAMLNASTPELSDTPVPKSENDKHSIGLRYKWQSSSLRLAGRVRFESDRIPEERVTPGNLDFAKLEVGIGARFQLSKRWSAIAQYSHLFVFAGDVNDSLYQPIVAPELSAFNKPAPTGNYSLAADQIGVFLSMGF